MHDDSPIILRFSMCVLLMLGLRCVLGWMMDEGYGIRGLCCVAMGWDGLSCAMLRCAALTDRWAAVQGQLTT